MKNAILKSLSPNIMTDDVNKSVDFYTDILGYELVMSVPEEGVFNWAMLMHGDMSIMFQKKENLLEEYPQLSQKSVGGALTFFIEVDNIDDIYKKLKNKVDVIKEPSITFYGMKEFAIKDCNGHILTFAQRQ